MSISPVEPVRQLTWSNLVEEIRLDYERPEHLYLVGGVVRDALRGRDALDIDLVTPEDGLKVARTLANRLGGAYYPVDPERRTGRVILEREEQRFQIDVASFRGETLLEDLKGRDFTLNAMAVSLAQPDLIIDPLDGQSDLFKHKLVRQCSEDSIQSDPIRAFRAIRQSIQLGLRLTPDTTKAIKDSLPHLKDEDGNLAQPERVRDELFKMIGQSRADSAIKLLHHLGLLEPVAPFPIEPERIQLLGWLDKLLKNISRERDDNSASNLILGIGVMILDRHREQLQEHLSQLYGDGRKRRALLVLATLCPSESLSFGSWADTLKLSNEEGTVLDGIQKGLSFDLGDFGEVDDRTIYRYFNSAGEPGIDAILIQLAGFLSAHDPAIPSEKWGELLDRVASPLFEGYFRKHQKIVSPPPLLTGSVLQEELNVKPGPIIGEILNALREEQAAGTITNKKQALAFARTFLP